jgi:hypothetical protein
MFQNVAMKVKEIQAINAGKKYVKSFFMVSSMFVRASRAGLRCSQERIGARISNREYQQQLRVYGGEKCARSGDAPPQ